MRSGTEIHHFGPVVLPEKVTYGRGEWARHPLTLRQREAYMVLIGNPTRGTADAFIAACTALSMAGYPHLKIAGVHAYAEHILETKGRGA